MNGSTFLISVNRFAGPLGRKWCLEQIGRGKPLQLGMEHAAALTLPKARVYPGKMCAQFAFCSFRITFAHERKELCT